MRGSRVAKRYARALLGLSEDRNQLEAWGAELERLARILDAPEVASRLESPEVSHQTRIDVVGKMAERLALSYPLRSFAMVVARHGRTAELGAIAQAYRDQLDEMLGLTRATLTFATPPSDQDVSALVRDLEAVVHRTVIATVNVDQSLLGGVVAELEGKIYDGSLATQLSEAQRRLAG
jgi:F-type H+-transporting ATPase subunit delta